MTTGIKIVIRITVKTGTTIDIIREELFCLSEFSSNIPVSLEVVLVLYSVGISTSWRKRKKNKQKNSYDT